MKNYVKIGEHRVGTGYPVYIIAEAGSNHNRQLDQARRLIDVAAGARVDAVKFQLFQAADLVPEDSPAFAGVQAAELPAEWLPELAEHARAQGIHFLASPFSRQAVDRLAAIDVPAYKWASSETTKLDLLKYAASRQRPILLSTAMCDLADVFEAVAVIRSAGHSDVVLLQCSALYPTPPGKVHLRVMDTLRGAFRLPVGFSDHSLGITMPVAAAARGACVVEKHFTTDRSLPGPDHSYALEPGELSEMVAAVRATESALGSPEKVMLPEVAGGARRYSLHAAVDIAAGEVITGEKIAVSRPGDGLRPRYMSAVVGLAAAGPLARGAAITWQDLSDSR